MDSPISDTGEKRRPSWTLWRHNVLTFSASSNASALEKRLATSFGGLFEIMYGRLQELGNCRIELHQSRSEGWHNHTVQANAYLPCRRPFCSYHLPFALTGVGPGTLTNPGPASGLLLFRGRTIADVTGKRR